VYEHVHKTVDASGNAEAQATATAKATVAAFAASEGQGHPRMVELEKVCQQECMISSDTCACIYVNRAWYHIHCT
jgi:hypothetical protein